MLILSKKSLFFVFVAVVVGVEYYRVETPSFVGYLEMNPIMFKFSEIGKKYFLKLINIAADLNFGTKHDNLRNLFALIFARLNRTIHENIQVKETQINSVNVSILSLARSKKIDRPILIYFHGGGFFFGHSDINNQYHSELIRSLDLVVISVDYRLSPEFPFPTPTEDCYKVTDYVFKNSNEFNGNADRIILAGDSAGGNIVSVITQRLVREKKKLPKLQVLIYPWLQLINSKILPSWNKYEKGIAFQLNSQLVYWYLGIKNKLTESEFLNILESNEHFALLDAKTQDKINSYLDVGHISGTFKNGRDYYEKHNKSHQYPPELPENHVLKRDKDLAESIKKLFSIEMSPGLADTSELKDQPDAYFIVSEYDIIKDETIIFAERLKKAGVNVKIAYYEHAFHGIVQMMHLKTAREMASDLIDYVKNNV